MRGSAGVVSLCISYSALGGRVLPNQLLAYIPAAGSKFLTQFWVFQLPPRELQEASKVTSDSRISSLISYLSEQCFSNRVIPFRWQILFSLQRVRYGRWDPAGPVDPLDYTDGALSSLAVVHVQLCWTFLVGWVSLLKSLLLALTT